MSDESQMHLRLGLRLLSYLFQCFKFQDLWPQAWLVAETVQPFSFTKKMQRWSHHTDHHTSHSLLFPQRFRDSETQRLRDSDRDTVTETETDYFLGVLWLLWSSVRVSICFWFKTRLLTLIDNDKPTTRLDRSWDTRHVSHVMWYLKKKMYMMNGDEDEDWDRWERDRWGDKIDEDNGIQARKR